MAGEAAVWPGGSERVTFGRVLTLGEELLLVALDPEKGVVRGSAALQIGLNAAGMAELVTAGRLALRQADGRPGVTVVEGGDGADTEQPLLEEVLFEARQTQKGDRHPERCLKIWRSPSLFAYLSSLREREVLTWDRPKNGAVYGRFHLLDVEAAASSSARVERIATGAAPANGRDADLAAIVHGMGLDEVLYKGRRNRSKRETLAALAKHRFSVMLSRVMPEIPGQKFRFDSSNDLNMAITMINAWDHTP